MKGSVEREKQRRGDGQRKTCDEKDSDKRSGQSSYLVVEGVQQRHQSLDAFDGFLALLPALLVGLRGELCLVDGLDLLQNAIELLGQVVVPCGAFFAVTVEGDCIRESAGGETTEDPLPRRAEARRVRARARKRQSKETRDRVRGSHGTPHTTHSRYRFQSCQKTWTTWGRSYRKLFAFFFLLKKSQKNLNRHLFE